LVCAIRKQSVQLTLERVRPQFDAAIPPPEKFHAMAKAHVIAMISELAYHRVVVEEMRGSKTGGATPAERALRLEIAALQTEYEGFFRSTLAEGIASGHFRDQDISIAVRSFLMMLHAPIYWYQPRDAPLPNNWPIWPWAQWQRPNEMLISQTPAFYAGAALQSQRMLP